MNTSMALSDLLAATRTDHAPQCKVASYDIPVSYDTSIMRDNGGNSGELTCVKLTSAIREEERNREPSDAGDPFAVRMQLCWLWQVVVVQPMLGSFPHTTPSCKYAQAVS